MKQEFIDSIPVDLKSKICLLGLQGSRGLGMAMTEDADYDYRGVFVEDLREKLGLNPPQETYEFGDHGDGQAEFVLHEVEKFIKLCIKGNPSALLILYLPRYEFKNDVGGMLLSSRDIFLGEEAIRKSFAGYALAQAKRLASFGKFTHGKKRAKHIRHIFRLFDQGQELLEAGKITMPLPDPQKYIAIGDNMTDQEVLEAFENRDKEFTMCKSVIPYKPNMYVINKLLLEIRGVKY